MKFLKRILAGFILLLAAAMLVFSLAAGIGIWFVRAPVMDRATTLLGRIEAALDAAGQGLNQVKASLGRAADRLNEVTDEERELARGPQKKSDKRRQLLAQKVQQRLAPVLGDSYAKLQKIAEAAVVINSVLEDVGNLPGLQVAGLEGNQLEAINSQLAAVSSSAWALSRLLGEPASAAGHDPVDEQLSQVEQSLQKMQTLLAQYEPRLTQVRQQTATLKARALGWITPGTIGIALVCYWIAFSQAVMMSRAWSWWRKSSTGAAKD
jgi:F0F1-type ATP synthase membrane subunit b/b'